MKIENSVFHCLYFICDFKPSFVVTAHNKSLEKNLIEFSVLFCPFYSTPVLYHVCINMFDKRQVYVQYTFQVDQGIFVYSRLLKRHTLFPVKLPPLLD